MRIALCRASLMLFLSTPSARRATSSYAHRSPDRCYFYPRPPRGGRPDQLRSMTVANLFLSTPSARRATIRDYNTIRTKANFYPRPPRGGRLLGSLYMMCELDFYPRPPRGGRHQRRS